MEKVTNIIEQITLELKANHKTSDDRLNTLDRAIPSLILIWDIMHNKDQRKQKIMITKLEKLMQK